MGNGLSVYTLREGAEGKVLVESTELALGECSCSVFVVERLHIWTDACV